MPAIQVQTSDKLGVIPIAFRALFTGFLRFITAPLRSGPRPKSLLKDCLYAALRVAHRLESLAQDKFLAQTTETSYLQLAKWKGFQPDSLVLSDGAKAYWLGGKNTKKVIVYFHGGGYVLPCGPAHVDWIYNVNQTLSKSHPTSAILLGYTTAPDAQYPTQLKQAAELIHYLMVKEGKKPSDIMIGGDSAGGNLALALLSHILHPHPDVPVKLQLSEPLAAAFLISPWVNFATTDDSFRRNEETDIVVKGMVGRWSGAFLGGAPLDNYNQPSMADGKWFGNLQSVAKDVLIWGGGGEILFDSIDAVAKNLKDAHPRVDYIVEPNAAHEEFILEWFLRTKEKPQGTRLVEEWLAARL